MRGSIVASVGLALALVVGGASAQEAQWRPAGLVQQSNSVGIGLRPPQANSSTVQRAAFANSPSLDGGSARSQVGEMPGQPMPMGPILKDEQGPVPAPLNTNAPPVAHQPGAGPVQGFVSSSVEGGPVPGAGANCYVCDDYRGHRGNLWNRLCNACSGNCCELDCCDACCDPCCDPCGDCCAPRTCFWMRGEYLLWTVKGGPTPPLVTGNSRPGGPPVLGVDGTSTLFGGASEDFNIRSGGRFTIGFGFPCTDNKLGFETTYFFLGDRTTSAVFTSDGSPTLGRPFTDVGPGLTNFHGNQNAELVAFPGVLNGSVSVATSNEIWGIEGNFRYPICCGCDWKVDFLTGFRYLQMDENLLITENLNVLTENSRGSGNIVVIDQFSTRNQFSGGQIGLDAECRLGRWFLGGTGKLALGNMHQSVTINGATTFSGGANPGSEPGGLLALQGTNIGQYSRDTFAVIPELGLRIGFYFTERFRGFVGYDVVYVSSVVRPGDQIDTNVNPTFLARNGPGQGAALPRFEFRATDFWAQGVSFGLEYRY